MFGKKKKASAIDKDQLELIEYAQRRIKQKKRLYLHFVLFLIGAVFLILANTVLGIAKDFTIAGIDWFVYAILIWLFLFVYHFINVFITNKFMGKDWEKIQLDKLVNQQQQRIERIKAQLVKEETKIAQTQLLNEELEDPESGKKKKHLNSP
jgi:dihydrofolate reductase